ncbi:MAG TPA: transglycosylase SLT domain-containing protein [Patescibacteria group bacterium]|nr:transglycosylase SLT domain-containing protein [Patescibacteria group bacterium]
MYKGLTLTILIILAIILCINFMTNLGLLQIRGQIIELQIPKYVVSKEPERISTTLIKTYPYLKIWGPDVIFYWSGIIYDQCEKRRIDWRVVCAKIHCESGFNPKAISEMEAKGIAQVLDSTASAICRRTAMTFIPDVTLMNDVAGMLIGINYLDQGIKKEQSIEKGLKYYYAGPGWRKNIKQGPINDYAKTVLSEVNRIGKVYEELYPVEKSFFLR